MKNILILLLFVTSITVIILFIMEKKRIKKNKLLKERIIGNTDEQELKLMVGYNYISNLNKLDSLVNEMINKEVDKLKIDYVENIINKTTTYIYGKDTKEKTNYYENEFLYKDSIINLDIIFYALNKVLKYFKANNYNSKELVEEYNNLNKLIFKNKNDKIIKKSKKIIKNKFNRTLYYEKVEQIKIEYKNLIDDTNPIMILYFIKDALERVSKTS